MTVHPKLRASIFVVLTLIGSGLSASDTLAKSQPGKLHFGISYSTIFGPNDNCFHCFYSQNLGVVVGYHRLNVTIGPSSAYGRMGFNRTFPVGVFLDIKYRLNDSGKLFEISFNLFSNYSIGHSVTKSSFFGRTYYYEYVYHSVYSSLGPQIKINLKKRIALEISPLFSFLEYGKWTNIEGFQGGETRISTSSGGGIGERALIYAWLVKTGVSYTFR
jgi:hypothetical protein